ncbi:MAG TPA: hypothetical protein VIY48_06430 [Candidatus Paceibacterota bacterium]
MPFTRVTKDKQNGEARTPSKESSLLDQLRNNEERTATLLTDLNIANSNLREEQRNVGLLEGDKENLLEKLELEYGYHALRAHEIKSFLATYGVTVGNN